MVTVSGADILVDGRTVADGRRRDGADGDLIAPLKAELDLLAKRQVIREENQAQSKAVTIMGDKDIPYQPAAQGDGHRGARQLQRRVVRGAPEGSVMSASAAAISFRAPILRVGDRRPTTKRASSASCAGC